MKYTVHNDIKYLILIVLNKRFAIECPAETNRQFALSEVLILYFLCSGAHQFQNQELVGIWVDSFPY